MLSMRCLQSQRIPWQELQGMYSSLRFLIGILFHGFENSRRLSEFHPLLVFNWHVCHKRNLINSSKNIHDTRYENPEIGSLLEDLWFLSSSSPLKFESFTKEYAPLKSFPYNFNEDKQFENLTKSRIPRRCHPHHPSPIEKCCTGRSTLTAHKV